ncbi:MAG TPA: hypothetical protein DCZ94_01135 [Lentisphaeria bacterium]|nr:MAG: hypothetical protein A2X48_11640 [Lentisphaerae bacterium GWF2_49_21]HBC85535.1 hypothetical protein [Lentisphaeria bacterium]
MNLIDNILEILWKLLQVLGTVVVSFLQVLWTILKSFWEFLCDIDQLSWFTERMNSFFEELVEIWDSSLVVSFREESVEFLSQLKSLVDRSKRGRYWFFAVLFILIFFWSYPPYKWGPWYYYESGKASYYGTGFYFNRTAGGERFVPFTYTAAHRTLPVGITVKVINKENGNLVYVQINDRGPCAENRVIDLSKSAAKKLGITDKGTARVEIYTRKRYGK